MDAAIQLGLIALAVTGLSVLFPVIGLLVAGLAPRTPGWGVVRILLAVVLALLGALLVLVVATLAVPNGNLSVLSIAGPLAVLNVFVAWRCVVSREPEP